MGGLADHISLKQVNFCLHDGVDFSQFYDFFVLY